MSKEFGVDTPDGRQVKQGVVGVFAGSAFNPREGVRLKDETEISLAAYAARTNMQLLKAADFNEKMRERGVPKAVTVQRVCRYASGEKQVREALAVLWENPFKADDILREIVLSNQDVYKFEEVLKLEPDEKRVLDHVRTHGGETDPEKTAEKLELSLKRVQEIIVDLRKKGLLEEYYEV